MALVIVVAGREAAQYGWFVALTLIPLAQVAAMEFTMPIWSAALAVALLGERMSGRKWFAALLGLVGVAVMPPPERETAWSRFC